MKPQSPVIASNPDIEVMTTVDFEPPEMHIVVESETHQFCNHAEIRLYPHHRLVKCRKCHMTLEPFDYLLYAGSQANNFLTHMKFLKIQMDRMVKEEQLLRNTVNSLKRKAK